VAHDAGALFTFQQGFDGAVRQAQQLHHHAQGADRVDVVGRRLGNLGVLLGCEQNWFLLVFGFFERLYRLLPSHEYGINLVRKNNEFTQRQQWNYLRGRIVTVVFFIVTKEHLIYRVSPNLGGLGGFLVDQQRRFLLTYNLLRN
jgi:hypothetical protein